MLRQRPRWWPRFSSTLRSTAVTARIGLALGIAIALLFVTGLLSHYQYEPWTWLPEPAKPVWGYRLTQGIHVATGIATIPLLLVKLWSVYPNLFRFPPIRSIKHALERLSVAILVSSGARPGDHRLPQRAELVPVSVVLRHGPPLPGYVLVGSVLLHIGVKLPDIAYGLKAKVAEADVLTEIPWNENPDSHSNAGTLPARRRRASPAAACWPPPGRASGSSCSPRSARRSPRLSRSACSRPGSGPKGPQGVPVNRTAEQAQVIARRHVRRRGPCRCVGPRPYRLDAGRPRAAGRARGAAADQLRRGLERRGELARPVAAGGRPAGRRHCGLAGPAASRLKQNWGFNHSFMEGPQLVGRAAGDAPQRAAAGPRPRLPAPADRAQPGGRAQHQVAGPDRGAVVKAWRIILAVAGIGLGAVRSLPAGDRDPGAQPAGARGLWLLAALVIHDGVLSPAVVGVGWLLRRHVPDRGRRYLQIALIMSALITVIAVPMIFLRGSQPAVKALLLRNYGANLILIIGIIACDHPCSLRRTRRPRPVAPPSRTRRRLPRRG